MLHLVDLFGLLLKLRHLFYLLLELLDLFGLLLELFYLLDLLLELSHLLLKLLLIGRRGSIAVVCSEEEAFIVIVICGDALRRGKLLEKASHRETVCGLLGCCFRCVEFFGCGAALELRLPDVLLLRSLFYAKLLAVFLKRILFVFCEELVRKRLLLFLVDTVVEFLLHERLCLRRRSDPLLFLLNALLVFLRVVLVVDLPAVRLRLGLFAEERETLFRLTAIFCHTLCRSRLGRLRLVHLSCLTLLVYSMERRSV